MTKKQIKEAVQDLLMERMSQVGYVIADMGLSEEEEELYIQEAIRQGDRVAKLFGYDGFWLG